MKTVCRSSLTLHLKPLHMLLRSTQQKIHTTLRIRHIILSKLAKSLSLSHHKSTNVQVRFSKKLPVVRFAKTTLKMVIQSKNQTASIFFMLNASTNGLKRSSIALTVSNIQADFHTYLHLNYNLTSNFSHFEHVYYIFLT